MIYFVQNSENLAIKVGYSRAPDRRLRNLQTASPDPLELLGTIPGEKSDEKSLHELLDSNYDSLMGEWYQYCDGLMHFIRTLLARPRGLLGFFQSQKVFEPQLCYITSKALGFAVSVYWFGLEEPRKYQIMRWDEKPGRGKVFWKWYLCNMPQFFDTPIEAASAFVDEWEHWLKRGFDPN